MDWYIILTIASLTICLSGCVYHFYKIIHLGKPTDYSEPAGKVAPALFYSFTTGMSPKKKESAYMHLPTYTAGILYHIGTFLSILLFIGFLFVNEFTQFLTGFFSAILCISGISGIGILVKRFLKKELSLISNPDDYISNILVTGFQFMTIVHLNYATALYYILASILLLYFPLGKLKHTIYFFAARYHLGYFYGRRGVWPPKN